MAHKIIISLALLMACTCSNTVATNATNLVQQKPTNTLVATARVETTTSKVQAARLAEENHRRTAADKIGMINPDKLSVGAIGKLVYSTEDNPFPCGGKTVVVEILQIIDSTNMLVCVIDDPTLIATAGNRAKKLWVRGVNTSGLVDGAGYVMTGVYAVSGTHRYKTTSRGTKTVFVLEPYKEK